MSKSNKKSMNTLFRRNRVKQSVPDTFWPLPSELIGIEIETENFHNQSSAMDILEPEWVRHEDGSLRNGVEWVLDGPLAGNELRHAIDKFFDAEFRYDMGVRTSTHIHINAADDLTVDQFRNIFTIMYLIEPAVFRWADEDRKWCGYCQPLTDIAPARLVQILNENDADDAFISAVKGNTHQDRYYGLNVKSFERHGTVEFRYFPCTDSKDNMIKWVQFVMEVKKAALAADHPYALLSSLRSVEDVVGFMVKSFKSSGSVLVDRLDMEETLARVNKLMALLAADPGKTHGHYKWRTARNLSNKGVQRLLTKRFGIQPGKSKEVNVDELFTYIMDDQVSAPSGVPRYAQHQVEFLATQAQDSTPADVAAAARAAVREAARITASEFWNSSPFNPSSTQFNPNPGTGPAVRPRNR